MYFCAMSVKHPWLEVCGELYVELSRRDLRGLCVVCLVASSEFGIVI
jgi:hypothetical protein